MNWLPRDLINSPFLALVLTPAEFEEALTDCDVKPDDRGRWQKNDRAWATAHFFDNKAGEPCAVVALKVKPEVHPIQICGLLVHEAVHVFQHMCERMGEEAPSWEFQAYSIQSIAQRLMAEYSARLDPLPRESPTEVGHHHV